VPSEPYSGEIMNPYFQNQSCDPFTPANRTCELGNYVSYSINVTGPKDVVAGIQFAKTHNVRLVIKNTGHEQVPCFNIKLGIEGSKPQLTVMSSLQLPRQINRERRSCALDTQLKDFQHYSRLHKRRVYRTSHQTGRWNNRI
jgi:hypothetical protein